jgi:hypothetical protein
MKKLLTQCILEIQTMCVSSKTTCDLNNNMSRGISYLKCHHTTFEVLSSSVTLQSSQQNIFDRHALISNSPTIINFSSIRDRISSFILRNITERMFCTRNIRWQAWLVLSKEPQLPPQESTTVILLRINCCVNNSWCPWPQHSVCLIDASHCIGNCSQLRVNWIRSTPFRQAFYLYITFFISRK